MKIHLSIDDVIYSFIEVQNKNPDSIFDISFFSWLRYLNEKYGAVFSLYAFENYSETFFVNDIPKRYWNEIESAGFLKIGFHGLFQDYNYDRFKEKCQNFYSVISPNIWSNTIRLHRYQCDKAGIDLLKKYNANLILCREDESRKYGEFPASYF